MKMEPKCNLAILTAGGTGASAAGLPATIIGRVCPDAVNSFCPDITYFYTPIY